MQHKRSRAQFLYRIGEYQGNKWLLIWDKNLGAISVTNDIENVVEDIADHEGIDPLEYTIVYRDSEGNWDGWNHLTQSFYWWEDSPQNQLFNHLLTVSL